MVNRVPAEVGTRFTIRLPIKNDPNSLDDRKVGLGDASYTEIILPSCL
jgi:hypothetical protein